MSAGALRHSAWVYLGGMVFYMGQVVRHLLAEGRVTEEDVRRVSFGLGGRGATFFKRYEGDQGPTAPLNSLLGCFVQGAGLDPARFPHRSVLTSPEAKLEVVLGMVGDSEDDRAQLARLSAPPLYSMTPLGETIRLGERVLDPDTATLEVSGGAGLQYPDLDGLNRFLAALGSGAHLEVDLMADRHSGAHAFIRDRVFKTLRQQADDRPAWSRPAARSRPPPSSRPSSPPCARSSTAWAARRRSAAATSRCATCERPRPAGRAAPLRRALQGRAEAVAGGGRGVAGARGEA
jgi:hypothetical protein